ncbi:MAG: GTPase [Anaerolineae bacterium]|nr:GTPase [Anaerolineae bacterium]NIN94056.1 GTPase [Anaerolineae bacterium]NIQ77097.1 GTPase [Anaerolineae bacterium]
MPRDKVIVMGAAGRDFHNFNVYFRNNDAYEVVAFTAAQIPDIAGRVYPPELAGKSYPQGIPIYAETELVRLIRELEASQVVFAYSDVSHEYVMHKASEIMAAGADLRLLGPDATMLESKRPVVSICAVRTGAGKSQTSRRVYDILQEMGKRVVTVRHPMPYGTLAEQICQRFSSYDDLDRYDTTIEEREEYEPHIDRGGVVYAGVDYEMILRTAEEEAEIILWDGGNNDLPFYKPTLHIVVADPHRAGHEMTYYPGEANARMADVVVINKVDTASFEDVNTVRRNVESLNSRAVVIEAASPISVEDPAAIRGKSVLVVEDGPTLTHGGMAYGAGTVAAKRLGAAEIVDPRPYAVGSVLDTFTKYPTIGSVLPAMGYTQEQIKELEKTISATPCELVIIATPINLRRVVSIDKPCQRVRYELQEIGQPTLADVLREAFA